MSFSKIYNVFVTCYSTGNPSEQTYAGMHALIRTAIPTSSNFKIYCMWTTTNTTFTSYGRYIAFGN